MNISPLLNTALVCLSLNIYHEARSQSYVAQLAVGQTVLNRVRDNRFPDSVCKVVKQGPTYSTGLKLPVRHKCQFSWWCDGKSDKVKDIEAWNIALHLSKDILTGRYSDLFEGITHYHADYVTPSWAAYKTFIVRIDNHLFYRWEQK